MLNVHNEIDKNKLFGLVVGSHPIVLDILEQIISNNIQKPHYEPNIIPIILKYLNNNNIKVLKGLKTYKGYLKRMNNYDDDTKGNLALIRGPLHTLFKDEHVTYDISLTNPNKISLEVSLIYTNLLTESLKGDNKMKILLTANSEIDEVELTIIDALSSEENFYKPEKKANCLDSLWCIIRGFLFFDDLGEALEWVEDKGGDIDTNIFALSALFGAFYGASEITDSELMYGLIIKKPVKKVKKKQPERILIIGPTNMIQEDEEEENLTESEKTILINHKRKALEITKKLLVFNP